MIDNRPSRRSFLHASLLSVLGNTLRGWSESLPQSPAAALPVKLGLASYTFRSFARAELIHCMQQLQVQVLSLNAKDVKDHLPMDAQAEAAALADYAAAGIQLHAAGTISFLHSDEADTHKKFEYCKRAGVGVIVAGDPAIEDLPHLERFARAYDMRIAIHNHGPEDHVWHSPLDVLRVVNGMDPRMGCCMDVGHAARAGTDVIAAIHAAGPRLFNVHLKDLADFQSKDSQVAVGAGRIPVRGIFEALATIGYPGFVDLEYEIDAGNPLPGVTSSFASMRASLAGISSRCL